ncbi:hypothetical protein DL765_000772 [Monosporascus sp. GIB2]|nr:hypothetical protein DL765_000772 [Monosporascus sp. GIB2]
MITFQRLILHQAEISDFHKIVQGRRRPLLEWIWLRLELPEYDCERCDQQESTYEKKINNITFTNALWDFFKVLSEWNNKKGNEPIFKALTLLENLRYETWRGIRTDKGDGRWGRDMENHTLFLNVFQTRNRTLKRVSISKDYDTLPYHSGPERECMAALGLDLARASRQFEELHAAYNVDVRHFFDQFWGGQPIIPVRYELGWPNLKYLSMTSQQLMPFANYDHMIQTAAAAALKMPNLDIMELWDCHSPYDQSLFRYERRQARHPRIQRLSTWNALLTQKARSAWAEVADAHGSRHGLEAETIHLEPPPSRGRHHIMKHLVLKSHLWNETSLHQIMAEGAYKEGHLQNIAYVLGALTASGGTIGFVKTGSVPSIAAGLTVGLLYGLGGYRIQSRQPWGVELALLASVVLGGSSIPRAVRLGKPVPTVLSVISVFGMVMFGNAFRKSL